MEFILQFTDPRFFTVALIALASFATVFTALSSLEKKDVLKQRMKIVQGEREKLRQAARQEAPVNAGNRLRVQQVNFLGAITDLFKLHDAVQASNVRDRLKQALQEIEDPPPEVFDDGAWEACGWMSERAEAALKGDKEA